MFKEIKRHYFNYEMLLWIVFEIFTESLLVMFYINSMKKGMFGQSCVIDGMLCISNNFAFPFMMIVASICNQRMMKCDRNSMIIMRYNSKAGIYHAQILCTLFYAFITAMLYVLVGIAISSINIKIFYNWTDEMSFFKFHSGSTASDTLFPEYIILLYFMVVWGWLAITCMLGMLTEIITDSDTLSGAVIIIFAGVDIFFPITYHKLLLFEGTWNNVKVCETRIIKIFIILLMLLVIGYLFHRKREYYEIKKE